ncbi:uro-adherence factor A-like [Linepithema humile]|uniref:uro-adherence factor A-like n=1 Tax=Linepithema humile TaxID=83485 RepID=UPI00351E7E42
MLGIPMLGKEILVDKMEDSSSKDNNVMNSESKLNRLFINWTSLTPLHEKSFFLKHRFGSPRLLSKSVPRRNKSLFQYKINRSLNFDLVSSRKHSWSKSPNSSLDDGDHSFNKDKSLRDLSRSAKIMRALSSDHNLLRHRNMSIKRSLNFDLTPSPEKSNSIDSNSHMDSINVTLSSSATSSSLLGEFMKLETNSSNSTANSALESMDENQNQTPQQNRKMIKISNNRTSDAKENVSESESSCSTSSFQSPKDNIDNMLCMTQTPDLQCLKRDNRSRAFNCVIIASTPRNLFQEFDQNEDNRPCTPENIMRLIPQSISSIKKSHKKEKLYCHEEESLTRQINVSVRKKFHTNIQIESLETDVFTNASCSIASITKSLKKNKSVKKTLIYDLDDKLVDTTSGFDDDAQWKTASRKNDLPEDRSNKTESAKVGDIDSIDCEKSKEDSDSIHFGSHNSEEENCSNENSCDKEVQQPSLQEDSVNICRVNASNENREVSTKSNSPASQSSNGAATPENSFNILEHVFTESIKKSHKKIKHENRKALFKTKSLHEKIAAEPETTAQDTYNNDQCEDIKNKTMDTSSSPNSNRPSTPENINSSRLLLPLFNSIKKSHKKDKLGKKIYSFSKSYKYENLTNTNKISRRNKSLRLKESPDILGSNKRKKSKSMSLLSNTCKSQSLEYKDASDEYKDASDEFKIYTPIKKVPLSLFTVTNCADETSQEYPIQTSKEINCSRCVTPVIHYSEKLRESNDLISKKCANIKQFVTDECVLKDKSADTINLKNKNGRSSPLHKSTTELLDNVNSIKKSHKKDKHDRSVRRRRVLGKKQSYTKESRNGNVASNVKVLEEHASLPFKSLNVDNHCAEMEIYSNILDEKQNKSYNEIVQGSPQPSTSQANDSFENATNIEQSELLSTTPSNDVNAINFIKVLHTTSIKKSHRKERDDNAQAKYILMSEEHELSDDGSIFNEDDRLNLTESFGLCQDSDDEMIN